MTSDDKEFEQELKNTFLEEAEAILGEMEENVFRVEKPESGSIDELRRLAHNLKGGALAAGFTHFGGSVHAFETVLLRLQRSELSPGTELRSQLLGQLDYLHRALTALAEEGTEHAEQSIRIALDRLDRLINVVGELALLKPYFEKHPAQHRMNKITQRLQDFALSLRMISLRDGFRKLKRIAREAASSLEKEIEVEVRGQEIEIDKSVLENILDPLMHLIHNAVDHGIEPAADRQRQGKPPTGKISLTASLEGDRIVIECSDDGRGLDPERLRKRATELGLPLPTEAETFELIFRPGFSTASKVTAISGRGVGMDVVKAAILRMGGAIEIDSSRGRGTCFRLRLPCSIAILDAAVVRAGTERYVLPLAHIDEVVRRQADLVDYEGDADWLRLRGGRMRLYRLSRLLGGPDVRPRATVIMKDAENLFGIAVDEVLGREQLVTKRLGPELERLPWLGGSVILADGVAALVLNVKELLRWQSNASSSS